MWRLKKGVSSGNLILVFFVLGLLYFKIEKTKNQKSNQPAAAAARIIMGVRKRCLHGKEKYYCYDCGGKGACACHKRKARCKIHGGHLLCKPHGIELYYCKRCKGKGICDHGFKKRHCRKCVPQGKPILCHHRLVVGLCLQCAVDAYTFNNNKISLDNKKKISAYAPVTKKQRRCEPQVCDQETLSLPTNVVNCLIGIV